MAIPSVGINLPNFKGLDNESLCYGAGTFYPDQTLGTGNYALASHRLEESDLENIYTYQVTVSTRINPIQVEVIEDVPDKKLVTLITCGEASAVTRWMVQGELTEVTAVAQGSEAMLAAFQMEKKAY